MGIIEHAVLEIHSTVNMLKFYSMGQLIFGCDIIILIEHNTDR